MTAPAAQAPPGGRRPLFDWAAWRARTGGVDGRPAPFHRPRLYRPQPAPPVRPQPRPARRRRRWGGWRSWNQRTGVAVLAAVGVGGLVGGLAALASTLGNQAPATAPAAAPSIAPGGMAGAVAVGTSGPAHPARSSPGASLPPLPLPQPTSGQPATAPAPGGHADPFTPAVAGYLAGRAGPALAAVYDLGTGQTWTFGGGRPQATGSVVKVDILEALLARHPAGLDPADQALARAMIENSSNDAATALWHEIGGASGLGSYNASAGLRQTTPSTCLVCAGFGWPGWGLTTTTPADQLLLLRELVSGPQLTPASRRYALSLMENVETDQHWGVSTGPPAGVQIALKNAWVPLTTADTDWQLNSEGWINGGGRDYLIAILTTGNPDEQYGIDTIDGLSALLWTAMAPAG